MVVSIRVTGQRRTARSLRRLRRRLPRDLMEPATKSVATAIRRNAAATQSFRDRTGQLRKSIRVSKARVGVGYLVSAGGPLAPYARFIERGTKYISPRRFMLDAFNNIRPRALRIMTTSARRNFRRTVRRIARR